MAIEWPDLQDVRNAILCGAYDEHLSILQREIKDRVSRTREFIEFIEGDRVVFNDNCGTKYLRGEKATITQQRRTKLGVRLDRSVGRFTDKADIIVPPVMLDKIS